MSSGCASLNPFAKRPPSAEVQDTITCPESAYEYAEGPVAPKGTTMEQTEVEDSQNRARWGRDIIRLNTAVSCLRVRDAGKPGVPKP